MTRRWILGWMLLGAAAAGGCRSPYYADRGAALGAVTGGLAGAAIGEHNGSPIAGTLLGAAAGTLAGAAIGTTIDDEVARSEAMIEARLGQRMDGATKVQDVIAMTQAGLSEDVIKTHIRSHGVAQSPTPSDLITMRNAGVGDGVLQAMQQAPPPQGLPVRRPGAVVVEEYHYVTPPPHWRHRHHHGHWHEPDCAPPGVHGHFYFGH